jgi:hypothetical protein
LCRVTHLSKHASAGSTTIGSTSWSPRPAGVKPNKLAWCAASRWAFRITPNRGVHTGTTPLVRHQQPRPGTLKGVQQFIGFGNHTL